MSTRILLLVFTAIAVGLPACTAAKDVAAPSTAVRPAGDVGPLAEEETVHFFSRKTGLEVLEDLELVVGSDPVFPDADREAPRKGLRSPIDFRDLGGVGKGWWVRGPRLAWTRVPAAKGDAGVRRVELESAGVLVVTLTGDSSAEQLRLRLARDGAESSPRDPGDRMYPYAIEGLAPGDVDVIVEGRVDGKLVRLATRRARIVEQEVTEVALDLASPPAAPNEMPLCGALRIPAEWGPVPFTIELSHLAGVYEQIGSPKIEKLEANLWSWTAGPQEPGRYMAFVTPFQTSFVFDYEPRTASNFVLAIAPPARVLVKFVDKLSGKLVHDERLGWYGMPPREPSSIVPVDVRFDPKLEGFAFKAPVGDIVLCLGDADEVIRFDVAHIAAGSNEIELRFASFVKVRVFALQDGKRVPWPEDVTPRAGGTSAQHARGFYPHADDIELGFDAPGSYEIELLNLVFGGEEIYEPASVKVDVVRGRIVEVEIPLKRRP